MHSSIWSHGLRTILTTAIFLGYPVSGYAFGHKPPKETQPPAPQFQQAKPYRVLELSRVIAPAFPLPNGENVNLTSELNTLIDTTINTSRYLRTSGANKSRLIISGGITALEMDILQFGIRFGWNKGGAIPISGMPNVSGEVDFHLNLLEMDFKIYDRLTGQAYVANYTNQEMSNLNINVHANISELQLAIDIIQKTGIAEAVRVATTDIMAKLENDSKFDLIPWEAEVLGVDSENGKLTFNAGSANGVRATDVYSVYSACGPTIGDDGCFSRLLADIKVTSATSLFSEAAGFNAADSVQNVHAGDKVYVKPLIQVTR
jgi:hypothetical protein